MYCYKEFLVLCCTSSSSKQSTAPRLARFMHLANHLSGDKSFISASFTHLLICDIRSRRSKREIRKPFLIWKFDPSKIWKQHDQNTNLKFEWEKSLKYYKKCAISSPAMHITASNFIFTIFWYLSWIIFMLIQDNYSTFWCSNSHADHTKTSSTKCYMKIGLIE